MASVNWMKCHSSNEAKAMLRHCDDEQRMACKEHSNVHIDKELTTSGVNTNLGKWTYPQAVARYKSRIDDLDRAANANKRPDRVTLVGLSAPAPANVTREQEDRFFKRLYEEMSARWGIANIMGAYIHRDEIHEYIDPSTKQICMSRAHMHVYVVPEVNGKLNCKKFSARAELVALNNLANKICRDTLGIDYNTGEAPRKKSSEELKHASELEADIGRKRKHASELEADIGHKRETLQRVHALTGQAIAEYDEKRQALDAEYDEKFQTLDAEYNEKRQALNAEYDEERQSAQNRLKALQGKVQTAEEYERRANGYKRFMGRVQVPEDDFRDLNAAAKRVQKAENDLTDAWADNRKLQTRIKQLEDRARGTLDDKLSADEHKRTLERIKDDHPELFEHGKYIRKRQQNLSQDRNKDIFSR